MQPINANNKLSNGHVFAVGMSGSGKSSASKKLFIKPTDQVIIFDPKREYDDDIQGRKVRVYAKLSEFAAAVIAGRQTKQGFKIAYRPVEETTPKNFDNFCKIAWGIGNGKHSKPIKVVCEEVAEHSISAGKATGFHGKLLRLGRAYNIHTINLFQRGQEVSKTIIDNCQFACVMMQKTKASAVYLERMTGIDANAIDELDKLEYLLQDGKHYKKGKIRW